MVQRILEPGGPTLCALAEETGVNRKTLWRWRCEATMEVKRGSDVKSNASISPSRAVRPDDLPATEKLRLVKEAAEPSENELVEFLRRHGLHEAQLAEWRRAVEEASLAALQKPKKRRRENSPEAKKLRELERELGRKDKALAEVTALLALKKKLELILGDEDESTTERTDR